MPWKKVLPMEEKMAFILKVKAGERSFKALCQSFGISRRTGYKWWGRYQEAGMEGLGERSHRPQGCPHASDPVWIERVVALRLRHPNWGPRKLRVKLAERHGADALPAASTLGHQLRQRGLVRPRRRRAYRPVIWRGPLTRADRPNRVWAVDFKGWFRTGDGVRCDPLTMSDLFSRYVLCCQVVDHQSYEAVRPVFERVFSQYGLPQIIRVDNGSPFASTGAGGLSRLSVWWLTLGVEPEFIAPGHPEQNGVHERMHRTLKADTTRPPAANREAQQERFEKWRQEFNQERPHEALNQQAPGRHYKLSSRVYGRGTKPFIYPLDYGIRRVRSNGEIRWRGNKRYVSESLVGQMVGLRELEGERWQVWFGSRLLGELHNSESGGLRPSVFSPPDSPTKRKKSVTHLSGLKCY
jgi:putative transposase